MNEFDVTEFLCTVSKEVEEEEEEEEEIYAKRITRVCFLTR
jgi:hypothetical protein